MAKHTQTIRRQIAFVNLALKGLTFSIHMAKNNGVELNFLDP